MSIINRLKRSFKSFIGDSANQGHKKESSEDALNNAEAILLFAQNLYLYMRSSDDDKDNVKKFEQYKKCIKSVAQGYEPYDQVVEKCLQDSKYNESSIHLLDKTKLPEDDLTMSIVTALYLRYFFNNLEWFNTVFQSTLYGVLEENDDSLKINFDAYKKYEDIFLQMVSISQYEIKEFVKLLTNRTNEIMGVLEGLSEEEKQFFLKDACLHFYQGTGKDLRCNYDVTIGYYFKVLHEISGLSE